MITNKSRFPDVDFLPESKQKKIGTVGGSVNLILVGREQGTGAPVVARSYTSDWKNEEISATPLYELMSHCMDRIDIPDPI